MTQWKLGDKKNSIATLESVQRVSRRGEEKIDIEYK